MIPIQLLEAEWYEIKQTMQKRNWTDIEDKAKEIYIIDSTKLVFIFLSERLIFVVFLLIIPIYIYIAK